MLTLRAEQTPDEILEAWRSAAGGPFAVTEPNGTVYVNPANIAYIEEVEQAASTVSF